MKVTESMNEQTQRPNPMDNPDLPQEVQGFNKAAFRQWRHHPMTRSYLRFLADHRQALLDQHQARWASNQEFPGDGEEKARQQIIAYDEILLIAPETITRFYLGPEDEGDEADETIETPLIQEDQ